MVILYSPKFRRGFKKLSTVRKQKVVEKIKILQQDPFDQKLRIHKLKGCDYFSLWIEYDFRLLFRQTKEEIVLLDIGDHDSVYAK